MFSVGGDAGDDTLLGGLFSGVTLLADDGELGMMVVSGEVAVATGFSADKSNDDGVEVVIGSISCGRESGEG